MLAATFAQLPSRELSDLIITALGSLAVVGLQLGQVMALVLSADLVIATAHFLMDRFGNPDWRPRWLGRIFENNRLHHAFPILILRHGPLANAAETLVLGAVIIVAAAVWDVLTWQVIVFASAVAISAVVHRWQHVPINEVHCLVKWLQSQGVLQARAQHTLHHRKHDLNFAVLTNAVNYILEKTRMLQRLECFINRCMSLPVFDLRAISEVARAAARRNRK